MFGIGFSEMVLIGLALIIFIKPEDYPGFLRSAGRTYGKMKKLYNELMMVKDKILKDIDEMAALEESKGAEEKAADHTD
jgi:sec-independent protein translocase protein TatB